MFDLTDTKKGFDFDTEVINNHRPNPALDIHTRDAGDGTHSIIISNLPYDFEDEFARDWTLQEARDVIRKMAVGNKSYQQMCRIAAQSRKNR